MNTIYENIMKLCEQHGISGAKMCNDIGVGKSLLSSLKSGRTKSINTKTAVKIAEYFDVPVGAVTGGDGYSQAIKRNSVSAFKFYAAPKAKDAALAMQYDAHFNKEKAAPLAGSDLNSKYYDLTPENRALIDGMIEQMLKAQSAD